MLGVNSIRHLIGVSIYASVLFYIDENQFKKQGKIVLTISTTMWHIQIDLFPIELNESFTLRSNRTLEATLLPDQGPDCLKS